MPRLCIEVDGSTLAQVTEGGVIDVPVTCLEIEDGLLATRFQVSHIDSLGTFVAHSNDDSRGPVLRIYMRPEERA